MAARHGEIRRLLSGGDRRSIADSHRVRRLTEADPSLVIQLAALTADGDWLVAQRALDLLEKLAREHTDWIAPYKKIFIGPLAASDKWEIRLQINAPCRCFAGVRCKHIASRRYFSRT